MLNMSQKLQKSQWEGCEQEYKKLMKQLEKKVSKFGAVSHFPLVLQVVMFEGKYFQMKRSRDDLLDRTGKQEKAIVDFQKVLLPHEAKSSVGGDTSVEASGKGKPEQEKSKLQKIKLSFK